MTAMSWPPEAPDGASAPPGHPGVGAPMAPPDGRAPESPGGFTHWVTPHLTRMSLLAGRLAPAADRDDVVQDALLRAWRARASFDPNKGTAGAWLLTIVANVARREGGRRFRRPVPVEPPDDVAGPEPAPGAESSIDLERAVAALPARQRLAVDCHYFAGLTVVETAAVMGCTDGTVKSTLAAARQRLRTLMEDSDEH